jgi:hypothetical protein
MKRELIQFADKYLKEINNENAAIFAGAGLSVASGLVNWKGLLAEIAEELNLNVDKENDLIALAQYYENEKGGRGSINSQLIDEFTKDVTVSENHYILTSLPIQTFWTTKLFTTALQGDLVSKTFLFIGFSFEDPNLEYILSRIRILLGNNTRDHYCFFRSINKDDYDSEEDYIYSKIKQDLKIKDLKRYKIQALLINNYQEITDTLKLIQVKLRRQNIFISGAAHDYGIFGKIRAEQLIYNLSRKLAGKNFKIISGFGLGIGSSVINGVLSHVYSSTKSHLDDYLIIRPFPQNIIDENERKVLWKQYREDMLSDSGIALFFFGNKLVNEKVEPSDGLLQEFEIAVNQGIKVIPVGLTGFVSEDLWNKVMKNIQNFYPNNKVLISTIKSLGDKTSSDRDIINNIIKAINLLQDEV